MHHFLYLTYKISQIDKEQSLTSCRPQTAPPVPKTTERVRAKDWEAVIGHDNPEIDRIPCADDLIDAVREAAWEEHTRADARGASLPPMSPLELRTVLKRAMQQRGDKVLPRSATAEPTNIETARGQDRYSIRSVF